MVGAIASGQISKYIGRKGSLMIASIPNIIGWLVVSFSRGNNQITVNTIQDLMELITTEMQSDNAATDSAAEAFFASTLRYIQFQKQKGGAVSEKYEPNEN
ncbi:vacuolar protein sorting-associated protein 35B-like isoform X2 [Spinacia oleracea]|uniref:Vacuolar protein sorting-associated protein 35B-like isoform X2 n=1 Tax=Spinacia oleracea TaxID=3562 RepID=A0ABM3R5G5_SPIOL|nr:vacuolar protein sorting-associated protein 35B-like isoform X2 [Spinacia oleracea]XP_056682816.1 vacuolar protein sorting-associated protein 35B-like isoform X2 [Spinacia oleracea]XP_056683324.1 vacuolar protein sorting-associated protein 35B-like isoform X2 [Spinacia oleracea]XP_056686190.1 vacuolar protein sorting-associated protein 35B-like isoform X2 [Spinacia oleracea]XP_056686367.1 vacuolar protein sorting-associated protein 35B-like isoform X2 [Spinacia oleracea]XP_056687811.1 vacuo